MSCDVEARTALHVQQLLLYVTALTTHRPPTACWPHATTWTSKISPISALSICRSFIRMFYMFQHRLKIGLPSRFKWLFQFNFLVYIWILISLGLCISLSFIKTNAAPQRAEQWIFFTRPTDSAQLKTIAVYVYIGDFVCQGLAQTCIVSWTEADEIGLLSSTQSVNVCLSPTHTSPTNRETTHTVQTSDRRILSKVTFHVEIS